MHVCIGYIVALCFRGIGPLLGFGASCGLHNERNEAVQSTHLSLFSCPLQDMQAWLRVSVKQSDQECTRSTQAYSARVATPPPISLGGLLHLKCPGGHVCMPPQPRRQVQTRQPLPPLSVSICPTTVASRCVRSGTPIPPIYTTCHKLHTLVSRAIEHAFARHGTRSL